MVELGIQICDALQYAHEHGVVHRDLKPSNLMVTEDGKVKLTDFGIAKDLDATALTATGRTLGTAAYMAPEQIRGTPAVSHKTDLYALGVVLYQMLVGKPPFEGSTPVVLMHCHLNEPPPRPSAKIHEIPQVLDDLVVKLMAKSPADRPWDAAAVGHEADRAARQGRTRRIDRDGLAGPGGRRPARQARGRRRQRAGAGTPPARRRAKEGSQDPHHGGHFRQGIAPRSTVFPAGSTRGRSRRACWSRRCSRSGDSSPTRSGPRAAYLFGQAEKLMASSRRVDWQRAREEYMKELDEAFPDHPYQEKLRGWRDKLLLEDAENRGNNLASGLNINLTKPNTDAKRKFVVTNGVATSASERGDDLAALEQWQKMAEQLEEAARPHQSEDPEERQWYLLALRRRRASEPDQ